MHEKAATCLLKGRKARWIFDNVPAEQWGHLRTSNAIESVFDTTRHWLVRNKGAHSPDTARLMVFASAKT